MFNRFAAVAVASKSDLSRFRQPCSKTSYNIFAHHHKSFKVILQQPQQVNQSSCLQMSKLTEFLLSRKPIKKFRICIMYMRQNTISNISNNINFYLASDVNDILKLSLLSYKM